MNSKRMKTGEHYLLSLARKEDDAQEQLVLYCTVSSCRELADGLFAIGFGFTALDPAKPEKSPVAPAPVLPVPPARPQPGGLRADEDEEGRIRDAILG